MPTLNPSSSSGLNNINLLQPSAYKITIDRRRYQNLEFFAQSVLHPTVTIDTPSLPYSRVGNIAIPGDKLTFSELSANILIDENMNSYTEMYEWLKRLVNENYHGPEYANAKLGEIPSEADITVSVLSSHNNVLQRIRYIDCVPTSLGDISFEASVSDVQPLVFPVTFRFSYFEFT